MPSPIPLVIDTDPGIDDALAILLALASPEVDLRLVTTVHGNVELAQTTENALRVLHLAGRSDVPVAAGAAASLVHPQPERAGHVHGAAGLGGVELAPSPAAADPRPAVVALAELLMTSPEPVTVAAVGPLTNLALLLRVFPEAAARIGRLVVMGGSAARGGNVTAAAEFNVWADPEAAQAVLGIDAADRAGRAGRHAAHGARRGGHRPLRRRRPDRRLRPRRSCSSTSTTRGPPTARPASSSTTPWRSPRRSGRGSWAPSGATSSSTPVWGPAAARRWSTGARCRRRRPRSRWPSGWTAPRRWSSSCPGWPGSTARVAAGQDWGARCRHGGRRHRGRLSCPSEARRVVGASGSGVRVGFRGRAAARRRGPPGAL